MKGLSAEARLRRLLRVFTQTGGEGLRTRTFDNLPEDARAYLLERAALGADELPVIAYFAGPAHWALVTTERIVLGREAGLLHVPWSELENATTDTAHIQAAFASDAGNKLSLSRLRLQRRNAEDVEIEVEAGTAFYGLWNVLKTIAVLRKD
ncbi:hypothetical protein [Corallococcus sicarius]|uniref:YokE-like PH domain-containing protein n=1 Tax=Corallococcus sicarius TaxID=2316726 RepID=A0A3A8N2R1_9BACT|nr:hypothetical protein [Corallococcus sicarius]RKH37820.1 hypothetical protein D7X12_28290 [Corallococcus sicarius]